jgi:hypothetical protein
MGAKKNGTLTAIARTCYWIQKLAGGRVAGSLQDVYPEAIAPIQINLRRERAERLVRERSTGA